MVFDRYGEPDVLHLRDVPVPQPQDGEVLIRVGYAGVNPADSKARSGQSARATDIETLIFHSSPSRSSCTSTVRDRPS
jgi:NADPH:quinone reductase-like Zn-dependent oxidoreductase